MCNFCWKCHKHIDQEICFKSNDEFSWNVPTLKNLQVQEKEGEGIKVLRIQKFYCNWLLLLQVKVLSFKRIGL